ncbi:MAG TPA: Crp/Fnr family transcriptional regulator [Thermoanaerobaculia bacterium]|nr:Crp/Fnr family transcriptional regulator [Thermoanaerobaculia bacterium]
MPSNDGSLPAHAPSLSDVFDRESLPAARLRFEGQQSIYATGDGDDAIYLIESGQVKLFMSSAAGKDCLLAIYAPREVFGESCLTGSARRLESASAMQPAVVRRASRRELLAELQRSGATDLLVQHLASRLAERQIAVFDLITMDAERRLAKVLVGMAEKLGTPEGPWLRVAQRIPHEELSQIVGTTRPRVTAFMQRFRRLGIVEDSDHRAIRIHREKARTFLAADVQF